MLVTGGSTDVTTYFQMRLTAGGDATGLTITDFDLSYTRSGAAAAAKVDATALAAADTAHTDNRGIEVDATDCPGLYRFDFPDAAFAAGVREVILTVKHASCFTESLRVEIDPQVHLDDDAITADKFDESTAFPLKSADTGATQIARVGADGDTLETLSDQIDGAATTTELNKVPKSDGSTSWNATALAAIQSEANDALVANHLDHLLAADYDPASKPGTATALLNELVENDSGVSRFTANALEEAPSGASASDIADAVWDEAATGHTDAGKAGAQLWTDIDAILLDTEEIGAAGAGLTDLATAAELAKVPKSDGTTTWNATALASINSQVLDVINVDTFSEPGQGNPPASPTLRQMIHYLYKTWRNKKDQTADTKKVYDDAGTTVDQKSAISFDGTTWSEGEMATGP